MEEQRFMTIRQTAKTGLLPECAIRRMVTQGRVPGFRQGNRFYVNLPAFRATLDEQCRRAMAAEVIANG